VREQVSHKHKAIDRNMFLCNLTFIFFREQSLRRNILCGMAAGIPRDQSASIYSLTRFLSVGMFQNILISPQFQRNHHLPFILVLSCIVFTRHEHIFYLISSAITSGPVALRVTNETSVFFFIVCMFSPKELS
jgi:hypothetical protein